MPYKKFNHSMKYISSLNGIFVAGGQGNESFYYDIKNGNFVEWGKMIAMHNKPALVEFGDYLYSFNALQGSLGYFEKTNLKNGEKRWERVDTKLNFDKLPDGKVIFAGGESSGKNTFIFDQKDESLSLTNGKNEVIPLKDKTFYPINEDYSVAIPSSYDKLNYIALIDRKTKSIKKIPYSRVNEPIEPEPEEVQVKEKVNKVFLGPEEVKVKEIAKKKVKEKVEPKKTVKKEVEPPVYADNCYRYYSNKNDMGQRARRKNVYVTEESEAKNAIPLQEEEFCNCESVKQDDTEYRKRKVHKYVCGSSDIIQNQPEHVYEKINEKDKKKPYFESIINYSNSSNHNNFKSSKKESTTLPQQIAKEVDKKTSLVIPQKKNNIKKEEEKNEKKKLFDFQPTGYKFNIMDEKLLTKASNIKHNERTLFKDIINQPLNAPISNAPKYPKSNTNIKLRGDYHYN